MAIQYINTGTAPNQGNGDTLRLAFTKINNNFTLLANNTIDSADVVGSVISHPELQSGIVVSYNSSTQAASFQLNIASENTLGGVRIGSGITVDPDTGAISAAGGDYNTLANIPQPLGTTDSPTFADLNVNGILYQGTEYNNVDYSNTTIRSDSNVDAYAEMVMQNHNSGTNASTDLVLMNDVGDEYNNIIDLGINSSNYSVSQYGVTQPGDGYLFTNGGNLVIGTQSPDKKIVFHAGGTTSNDSTAHFDQYAWQFNRPVTIDVNRPIPLNFSVINRSSNVVAQSLFAAINDAGTTVHFGLNSSHPEAFYGNVGPNEAFLHIEESTSTLHIGNAGSIAFYSNEVTGYSGTPTLIMSRVDQSSTFAGNLLPAADLTYDLGSSSTQWRSLYVGTSTIYLGGVPLSIDGDTLTINGAPITGVSSDSYTPGNPTNWIGTPTVATMTAGLDELAGRLTTVETTGVSSGPVWELTSGTTLVTLNGSTGPGGELSLSSGTYISWYGDGVDPENEFLAMGLLPGGLESSTTSSFIFAGGTPFNITVASGPQSSIWTFGMDGSLTTPGAIAGNGSLTLAGNTTDLLAGKYLQVRPGDNDSHIHFDSGSNSTYDLFFGDDNKYLSISNTGSVYIGTINDNFDRHQWKFGTDGVLLFPGAANFGTALGAPIMGGSTDKLRLYDFANEVKVNYAIGVESGYLWNSVDGAQAGIGFKWYGGDTQLLKIEGDGTLTLQNGATLANSVFTAAEGTNAVISQYDGRNQFYLQSSNAAIQTSADGITFNTWSFNNEGSVSFPTPTSPSAVTTGMIAWNPVDNTFDMGLLNGVVLQAGQETHMYVKASENISNGQTVMFAGVSGDNILIRKYNPTINGFMPEWFVGVATQDLIQNEFGYVTVYGKVHNLNTNAYNDGDILYADNTTAGGLTTSAPAPGKPHIVVAAVTKKSGGDGHIMVRPNIRPFLNDLPDVNITNPTNGQVLKYNATGGYWINAADATGAGGSGIALTDLSVSTVTASGSGSLSYDDAMGVFTFAPADLSSISLTGYATETFVTTQGYLTTASVNTLIANSLTNYATETFVTTQGYLTTASVNTLIANSLTNYVTSSTLNSLGYITTGSVNTLIANSLTNYVTSSTLSSKGYITSSSLSVTQLTPATTGSLTYSTSTGVFSFTPTAPYTLTTATASVLGGVKIGTGLTASGDGTISTTQNLSTTSNVTFNNVVSTGQIIETFQTYSTSISTSATINCSTGNIINVTSTVSGNWTAILTNVAVTTNQATNVTLIINQGATAYIPNAVSINGTSSTINWQGGATPSGNATKKDVVAFSILQTGASTYLVFGQLVTFG